MLRRLSKMIPFRTLPPLPAPELATTDPERFLVDPTSWKISPRDAVPAMFPEQHQLRAAVYASHSSDGILLKDLVGFRVRAAGRIVGTVCDFVVDDATWTLNTFVIELKASWTETMVPVRPEWVRRIDFQERVLELKVLDLEMIENGPRLEAKKWTSPASGLTPSA
jgi:hypothetical protein